MRPIAENDFTLDTYTAAITAKCCLGDILEANVTIHKIALHKSQAVHSWQPPAAPHFGVRPAATCHACTGRSSARRGRARNSAAAAFSSIAVNKSAQRASVRTAACCRARTGRRRGKTNAAAASSRAAAHTASEQRLVAVHALAGAGSGGAGAIQRGRRIQQRSRVRSAQPHMVVLEVSRPSRAQKRGWHHLGAPCIAHSECSQMF